MKIRNGFVSNSSSSSFVIFGCVLPSSKLEEFELEEWEDFLDNKLMGTGLVYSIGLERYADDYIIGVNPNNLDTKHSIDYHKNEIAEKINKIFNFNVKVEDISFKHDYGYN